MTTKFILKINKNTMKKSNLISLFVIALIFSSCFGGLLSPDSLGGGSMSCNINGSSWKASEATGLNILSSISITGTNGSGKNTSSVLLTFDKASAKTGTTIDLAETNFNVGSALTSYTSTTNGVDAIYAVTEGTIKITAASGKKVEGTFSFTAEDFTGKNKAVKLESGKFSVSLLL
jgi:Family of unknown function (DUF6252)